MSVGVGRRRELSRILEKLGESTRGFLCPRTRNRGDGGRRGRAFVGVRWPGRVVLGEYEGVGRFGGTRGSAAAAGAGGLLTR